MNIKNLVIGAGLSGIVLAQKLAEKGEDVLVIEKRNHIGGNCYDYYDENGILIHKYGPHIFHTEIKEVRDYVNQFAEFTTYQHETLGFVDGNLIPIPFNFNSLYAVLPKKFAEKIEEMLLAYYEYNTKVTIGELIEKAGKERNQDLLFLADFIYKKIFKFYTMKQWGVDENQIDPEVMKRVPIIISRDNRYFPNQKYQGLPVKGYTKMFEKMLDSPHIKVILNCDYKDIINEINYEKLFVTSPIDEFFDYKYGELNYGKTKFQLETYNIESFQGGTIVNYPNDYEWTRITEMKKFYPLSENYHIKKTVILKEIPLIGDIKSYPVNSEEDKLLLQKYQNDANQLTNTLFLGRLANYKYRDMDKTIKNVLDFFNEL